MPSSVIVCGESASSLSGHFLQQGSEDSMSGTDPAGVQKLGWSRNTTFSEHSADPASRGKSPDSRCFPKLHQILGWLANNYGKGKDSRALLHLLTCSEIRQFCFICEMYDENTNSTTRIHLHPIMRKSPHLRPRASSVPPLTGNACSRHRAGNTS